MGFNSAFKGLILAHRSQVCFMSAAEQRRTMIKCRKNV